MTKLLTALSLNLLGVTLAVGADTVETKTGERVEGTFKQATSDGVVIEVAGQSITISLAKVKAIYLGAAPTPSKVPSLATEAIDALKAVQSVTKAGVNYREYATRMLNARVIVDKYLASAGNNDEAARASVSAAMRFYELIGLAWNAEITQNGGQKRQVGLAVRKDDSITTCPLIQTLIAESDAEAAKSAASNDRMKMSPQNRAAMNAQLADFNIFLTGSRLGQRPSLYWPCADSNIADAERASEPR